MFKYVSAFALLFAFVGCGNDSTDNYNEGSLQEEMAVQMEQPAMDADVTDDELELFITASTKAQEVQMGAQQEMIGIVEAEGIDVNTYSEIAQALQMGQPTDELGVDDQDLANFEKASEAIEKVEEGMMAELTTAIEDEGMGMDRFQEINLALQQDPELQQRAQQLMQSQMEQAPQQPQPEAY